VATGSLSKGIPLTSKKALKVWVLAIFMFMAVLGTLHAWILWQTQGIALITLFSFPMEVTNYFAAALLTSFSFVGAICYVVFNNEPLELPLYRLSKDFEEKLEVKNEELVNSTYEALTKLGLRGFQLKETMQTLQNNVEKMETRLKESEEKHERILNTSQKKLMDMERKLDGIQTIRNELSGLKKRWQILEGVDRNLKVIQGIVEKSDSVSKPYLSSTEDICILEGRILKPGTVNQLKLNGIEKVEDLLLKSPVEIGLTKVMSENEAKSLHCVLQFLMIPGIQHKDAVLLLKSGVNSRQELALQDALSLGARISKTSELYVKEGKIKDSEKPTLEEIASWIKWAKS
jgi:hypothetical protein